MDAITRLKIKLRLIRQGLELTQEEVSSSLGISLRTFQRLESGQTPIDCATLYTFCSKYNIPFVELTRPDVTKDNCPNYTFFHSEKDFLSHPEVDEESFLKVREKVKPIIDKNPNLIKTFNSSFFHSIETPLYVADLSMTVANNSLQKMSSITKESTWRTLSKWDNKIQRINAWDLCLMKGHIGFFANSVLTNGSKKVSVRNFNWIIPSTISKPIIIGQLGLM
ncbi:MAG: helix-turn-helix domain-containing protein [Bacteriovoracaceae bacterium]|nr:helix-turn-helix domain-containing protein [Bacteriovoracaceae bacterium]